MNDDEIKRKLHEYTSTKSTETTDSSNNGILNFEQNDTAVKNVCFVLLDGKHIFLNYNYLIAGEFFPEDNKIVLRFTTNEVTLQGQNLEKLYFDLMQHLPKLIEASDDRYSGISKDNSSIITEIGVK